VHKFFPRGLLLIVAGTLIGAAAQAQEWQNEIRNAVREHQLATALTIANRRLEKDPNDWETLGWHARILSWQGQWAGAELEYRRVLEHVPNDADVLVGLADVLLWQGKYEDVAPVLDRAARAGAVPAEIQQRRSRLLSQTRHEDKTLRVGNEEAPRYELRVGNDTDFFNFTDAANAQALVLLATWNPRWKTTFSAQTVQRFGSLAEKLGGFASYRFNTRNYISVGGAFGSKQDVISRFDENVEFGHAFEVHAGLLRGLETVFEQKGLWFTSSQVTLLRGSAIVYLPRDWTWAFTVSGAKSHFDGAGSSWSPAGSTKLTFPLQSRIDANVFYAVGSENYAVSDQIGEFSAHTYGGGLRFHLTPLQDFSTYGAFQQRSQGRTQTSMGFNYGIRF